MIYTSGRLCVETTPDGCFYAKAKSNVSRRLKLLVIKGGKTLTYDLKSDGKAETFPLQLGDGRYEIILCENIAGKRYSKNGTVYLFVTLTDKNAPFLHPNQYVNYAEDSDVVLKARGLCFGKSDKQAYDAVCNYMKTSFAYDFIKASTMKGSVLPDINGSFSKHTGVCQDLAAIMSAMLRSQGIPSKMVIGYADRQYHAWTENYVDGKWVLCDPTAVVRAIGEVKKYSAERCY